FGDLELDVLVRLADAVRIDLAVGLRGDVDRRLGLPVELLQVQAERPIEAEDFRADRLAGRIGDPDVGQSETIFEWPVDQDVAQSVKQARVHRNLLAIENPLTPPPR